MAAVGCLCHTPAPPAFPLVVMHIPTANHPPLIAHPTPSPTPHSHSMTSPLPSRSSLLFAPSPRLSGEVTWPKCLSREPLAGKSGVFALFALSVHRPRGLAHKYLIVLFALLATYKQKNSSSHLGTAVPCAHITEPSHVFAFKQPTQLFIIRRAAGQPPNNLVKCACMKLRQCHTPSSALTPLPFPSCLFPFSHTRWGVLPFQIVLIHYLGALLPWVRFFSAFVSFFHRPATHSYFHRFCIQVWGLHLGP